MNNEIEVLAQALWEVVPYDRGYEWDIHPNEEVKWHYRARACKLLGQFEITKRSPRTEYQKEEGPWKPENFSI